MRNAFLNIVIVLIALWGGAAPAANGPQKLQKSVSKTDADRQIEQNLQAKLAKSKLAADHFTFSISHGIATIEGVTDVPQHKGVMTRMAKASGAVGVRNNIQMSPAAKVKTAAALAKAQVKSRKVRGRTGTSVPQSKSAEFPQVPRAEVLPQDASR